MCTSIRMIRIYMLYDAMSLSSSPKHSSAGAWRIAAACSHYSLHFLTTTGVISCNSCCLPRRWPFQAWVGPGEMSRREQTWWIRRWWKDVMKRCDWVLAMRVEASNTQHTLRLGACLTQVPCNSLLILSSPRRNEESWLQKIHKEMWRTWILRSTTP